jgi:hypothetical protein
MRVGAAREAEAAHTVTGMRLSRYCNITLWMTLTQLCCAQPALPALRPPAVPLVVNNPYTSAWVMSDRPTDEFPRHWTGSNLGMCGLVMVDGKPFRWMGPFPQEVPAAELLDVKIEALSTTFRMRAGGVDLEIMFVSPSLAQDPAYLSWSGTVIYLGARHPGGADSQKNAHAVSYYVDISGEWCTHESSQHVSWSRVRAGGTELLSMGAVGTTQLARSGDATRIDWGRIVLAGHEKLGVSNIITSDVVARRTFARTGVLPGEDETDMPRAAHDRWPVLAHAQVLGRLESGQRAEGRVVIAYDQRRAVEYFERPLKPYWAGAADPSASAGSDFIATVIEPLRDDVDLRAAVVAANARIRAEALAAGGEKHARLCELAYRQVMGAHSLVADADGTMLMFSKENSSNGCMGTVDVTFPAAPFFLVENPALLAAQLRPILTYAAMPHRWKFPFAPHDIGLFPKANGQVYGGGEVKEEGQMPVEETANMLIMLAGLHRADAALAAELCRPHTAMLRTWATYLREHGLDPVNQLNTDDFTGPLARNVNLSLKAGIALGAYSKLLAGLGAASEDVSQWRTHAHEHMRGWLDLCAKTSGAHDAVTPLAFGSAGTWSMKYNMFWDLALGLDLVPKELVARELQHYITLKNTYGTPLDNRADYTKLDFLSWTAACAPLGPDDATWRGLSDPIYDFVDTTPDRVPLADWYNTKTARNEGFKARSVVGGLWARQLRMKWENQQK